jgi:hypothetical protein
MGKKKKIIVVSLLMVLLSSCASSGPIVRPPGLEVYQGGPAVIVLELRGQTERCARVSPEQELRYSFSADDRVSFTIQTVAEDNTREIIHRDVTDFFTRGTLAPEEETTYCLNWKIWVDWKVRIDYRVDIVDR